MIARTVISKIRTFWIVAFMYRFFRNRLEMRKEESRAATLIRRISLGIVWQETK